MCQDWKSKSQLCAKIGSFSEIMPRLKVWGKRDDWKSQWQYDKTECVGESGLTLKASVKNVQRLQILTALVMSCDWMFRWKCA